MVPVQVLRQIARESPTKILLLVIDGLGGLPHPDTGQTELETACLPNLDSLAACSICGLIEPVGPGITPGSGPGHLALFGYDPVANNVGRGALSALGVGLDYGPRDVAARVNFATVDRAGLIVDRRAGRISNERNAELCTLVRERVHLEGASLFLETEMGHRAALIFRGEGLSDRLSDSDPQRTGVPPLRVEPLEAGAEKTAALVNSFLKQAAAALAPHAPANMMLLRGFAKRPELPTLSALYRLTPAAIAAYPMYRGLARLVGMKVLDTGSTLEEEIATLHANWERFDFFFLHFKATDTAGEDGDFAGKVAKLEEVDAALPSLLALNPDVLAVTGDHSTPAVWRAHSWHPVPFLLCSRWCLPDLVQRFTERAFSAGSLGRFPGQETMALMLAHAGKLEKFGG